jgi:phage terminase large subunit-like protein
MAPATDAFYQAIVKREVTWDGTRVLRDHALVAVAKQTPLGSVITKDARHPQYIDALVAAILAYEAARTLAPRPEYAIY